MKFLQCMLMLWVFFFGATNAYSAGYPKPDYRLAPLFMTCYQPGMVALTFDDGPSANFPQILDILAANQVTASFFILGKKLTYDYHVARAVQAVQAGHYIENHGWDHTNFMNLTVSQVIEQVDNTNQIIWDKLGVVPRFVRAPHGAIDAKRAIGIWDLDQGIASWNLDPLDYRSNWTSEQVLGMVRSAIEAGSPETDSFIIDLHDASNIMVEVLDEMIKLIKSNQYAIVSLHECIDRGRQ
ncbi:MAG: polysaccharide deacetylase family protein [Ketobacteraceae bacterium]|nr:polysaccharide deacetylase family protein [Ketobacteraceae bacterium]